MLNVPKTPKLTNSPYWNSSDSAVFIINTEDVSSLLEIVTFEYSISSQKLPIYGYKSVSWDTVMKGNRLVQGTFSTPVSSSYDIQDFFYLEDLSITNAPDIKTDLFYEGLTKNYLDVYIGLTKNEIELKNGVYVSNVKKSVLKLDWMILTAKQQVIDPSGGQLLEVYNFLAKERLVLPQNEINA
jgi:hypothetical protein